MKPLFAILILAMLSAGALAENPTIKNKTAGPQPFSYSGGTGNTIKNKSMHPLKAPAQRLRPWSSNNPTIKNK